MLRVYAGAGVDVVCGMMTFDVQMLLVVCFVFFCGVLCA